MSEPRTWEDHAGRDTRNGGFCDIGHPRFVQAYGHTEVVPVLLTEDPEGAYWGWLSETSDRPYMVQGHEGVFEMQFPYGSKAEEKHGKGRVVKLRIEERTDT